MFTVKKLAWWRTYFFSSQFFKFLKIHDSHVYMCRCSVIVFWISDVMIAMWTCVENIEASIFFPVFLDSVTFTRHHQGTHKLVPDVSFQDLIVKSMFYQSWHQILHKDHYSHIGSISWHHSTHFYFWTYVHFCGTHWHQTILI